MGDGGPLSPLADAGRSACLREGAGNRTERFLAACRA